jgi:hypothetical protein
MAVDVELTRRRFTLDEYHRMVEVGILNRDHAPCVARLTHVLLGRLHGRTVLWPQNPLTILPDSEPQPDIILLAWRDDFYRRAKGALYTEAAVRDDWIVDLDGDAVEVHRDPGSRGFGRTERTERLTRGSTLAPLAFPDVTLSVADLLG